MVNKTNVKAGDNVLNVANLAPGVYLVNMGNKTQKFVKKIKTNIDVYLLNKRKRVCPNRHILSFYCLKLTLSVKGTTVFIKTVDCFFRKG